MKRERKNTFVVVWNFFIPTVISKHTTRTRQSYDRDNVVATPAFRSMTMFENRQAGEQRNETHTDFCLSVCPLVLRFICIRCRRGDVPVFCINSWLAFDNGWNNPFVKSFVSPPICGFHYREQEKLSWDSCHTSCPCMRRFLTICVKGRQLFVVVNVWEIH